MRGGGTGLSPSSDTPRRNGTRRHRGWRMQKRRTLPLLACALILNTLAGCATPLPESPPAAPSFCALYRPVYHSPADTEETRAQIDVNNATCVELCPKLCPLPEKED